MPYPSPKVTRCHPSRVLALCSTSVDRLRLPQGSMNALIHVSGRPQSIANFIRGEYVPLNRVL